MKETLSTTDGALVAGREYDLAEDLVTRWIAAGIAVPVVEVMDAAKSHDHADAHPSPAKQIKAKRAKPVEAI